MFGRQWFAPGSQLALEDEALNFENLLRKAESSKAIEMADKKLCILGQSNVRDFWLRQRARANRLIRRNPQSSVVTVAFTGFWPGFEENNNEILNILREAASFVGIQVHISNTDPDILIYSCFGDPYFSKYPEYKNSIPLKMSGQILVMQIIVLHLISQTTAEEIYMYHYGFLGLQSMQSKRMNIRLVSPMS